MIYFIVKILMIHINIFKYLTIVYYNEYTIIEKDVNVIDIVVIIYCLIVISFCLCVCWAFIK